MDSHQRVIRALRSQTPDRTPIDLSWGMTQGMCVNCCSRIYFYGFFGRFKDSGAD